MPAIEPRDAESVPVQLTRMEGVLNLVLERTSSLATRMDRAEGDIGDLKGVTQRLELNAKARDETAVALALALKDAKEAQEATARAKAAEAAAEAARSERAWSPMMRFSAILASIATFAGFIIGVYVAVKG